MNIAAQHADVRYKQQQSEQQRQRDSGDPAANYFGF